MANVRRRYRRLLIPDTTRTDNFIEVLHFDTIANEVEGRFQVFMGKRAWPQYFAGGARFGLSDGGEVLFEITIILPAVEIPATKGVTVVAPLFFAGRSFPLEIVNTSPRNFQAKSFINNI